MNVHQEQHKCRYCQIDLVDIQQITAASTQSSIGVEKKQSSTTIMKCPVCGYSELDKPSTEKFHNNSSNIAIFDFQAPTA